MTNVCQTDSETRQQEPLQEQSHKACIPAAGLHQVRGSSTGEEMSWVLSVTFVLEVSLELEFKTLTPYMRKTRSSHQA